VWRFCAGRSQTIRAVFIHSYDRLSCFSHLVLDAAVPFTTDGVEALQAVWLACLIAHTKLPHAVVVFVLYGFAFF